MDRRVVFARRRRARSGGARNLCRRPLAGGAGNSALAQAPPEQDASELTLLFEGGVTLDVLTSRNPEGSGAIAKFLLKFGEGLQQVEFRCSDVNRATAILRDQMAVVPVYREARPGADGTRVNFFLADSADGEKVLIELYEPAAIRLE